MSCRNKYTIIIIIIIIIIMQGLPLPRQMLQQTQTPSQQTEDRSCTQSLGLFFLLVFISKDPRQAKF